MLYRRIIVYPNIPSAPRPIKHDDSLPIRKPSQLWTLRDERSTSTSPEDVSELSCSSVEPDFPELTVPHLISQSELNDLVTDPIFRKFSRNFWFLVYRSGIYYSKVFKYHAGNASNNCHYFFLRTSN